MPLDLRFPKITAATPEAQIQQLHSYMYQLVEKLNWALDTIESGESTSANNMVYAQKSNPVSESEKAESNFAEIKSLIIKSADIVNAYYEEINTRLSYVYVAESEFGTYAQQTTAAIEATSNNITQNYTNTQELNVLLDSVNGKISELQRVVANAYIRTGQLDDGDPPTYGLEIGQTNVIDGVKTFSKFARFTSDRLSFYDQNSTEVAYVSDNVLHITRAEFGENAALKFYRLDSYNSSGDPAGLCFKWIGDDITG